MGTGRPGKSDMAGSAPGTPFPASLAVPSPSSLGSCAEGDGVTASLSFVEHSGGTGSTLDVQEKNLQWRTSWEANHCLACPLLDINLD